MRKFAIFFVLILLSVTLDQITKFWAIDNLASNNEPRWHHPIVREVSADQAGMTVEEWAADTFGHDLTDRWASDDARGFYRRPAPTADGGVAPVIRVAPDDTVQPGDTMQVEHREITVIGGFWNHIYVQNFGAAWGMFSDRNESFRKPFFIAVTIIAIGVMFWILLGIRRDQLMLTASLSLIVAGAVGNFIDRLRYGYVIDFIDWYVVLDGVEKHWPTFNIADVSISFGVAFMLLDMLLQKAPPKNAEANEVAAEKAA